MPRVSVLAVEPVIVAVLAAHGAPPGIAADVAAHLLLAERSGHASHGLSILPGYLAAVDARTLDPAASPERTRDDGVFLAFDGRRGYGQHVARVAVDAAIERTRDGGACFLTVANSHHLGRAGHYGEMAARAGFVLLAFLNVVGRRPTVAPFGGAEARLSTNPLCFAFPMGPERPPMLLDFATSGIALNKARLMAAADVAVAPGLMIDGDGRPTTDAGALFGEHPGSLLPFGAHKGYALGVMAELLAGVLSGGATVAPANARDGALRNNLFAVVVDPARFGDATWQAREGAAFAAFLNGCPPAPDVEGVLLPGEPEADHQAASVDTVEMTDAAWRLFADCVAKTGGDADRCLA